MAEGEVKSSTPETPAWGALIVAVGMSMLWVIVGAMVIESSRDHDFLNLFTGASLAREGRFADMHDPDVQFAKQKLLLPRLPEVVPFVRPSYYALVLSPISRFPFENAFWIWTAWHSLVLIACWAWAVKRFGWDALIFSVMYFPGAAGIIHGQDAVVMLVIGIAGYVLADGGRNFWGGFVWGLGLFKFHLLLLLPLAMLVRKERNMFAGFAASGGAALVSFIGLSAITGVRTYLDLLQRDDLSELSPGPEVMVNVHAITANVLGESMVLSGVLVTVVVGLVLVSVWRAPLWRWVAASLTGCILVPPHAYGYDASILLLPVWLVLFVSKDRYSRFAAATLAVPLPFIAYGIVAVAVPSRFFAYVGGELWRMTPTIVILLLLVALARENYLEVRAAPAS